MITEGEMFNLSIEEARDRLMTGVADNIDEVIAQLLDESIILPGQEEAMRRSLDQER